MWRGGRPFKVSSGQATLDGPKTNGANNDAVMIIDSDDENSHPAASLFVDEPDFEEEENEFDPAKPYPQIIQHLDLHFGTAALHLSVPPVSISALDAGPAILKDKAVIVAAFADHSIRLITLPLTPPSPASKLRPELQSNFMSGNAGNGKWGETVTELTGYSTAADGLSLTLTPMKSRVDASSKTERKSRSSSKPPTGNDWQILVASHSREVSGVLLIHQIPIIENQTNGKIVYTISKENGAPSQTQYLSSPATTISFNPSVSQGTQILLADNTGACRIYDCQASAEGPGSGLSGTGSWLLTMYPGFQSSKSDAATALSSTALSNLGRKSVVDAKWAMGGKAVIVLLADGEWGLWDIEGNGPSISKSLLSRKAVKGGATTAFSATGWIDGPPLKSSSRGAVTQSSSSKFAPMTPGARKTAEPVLFSGRSGHGFVRGQISVTRLPTKSTTSPVEECVAFWMEDSYSVISNLRSYWEAQVRRNSGGGGNLFNGASSGSRTIKLDNVNLRGERCSGIVQYPRATVPKNGLPTELLIIGEHRFIILSDASPEVRSQQKHMPVQTQSQLVATGNLDVTGIDQALVQMENGAFKSKRKIEFNA